MSAPKTFAVAVVAALVTAVPALAQPRTAPQGDRNIVKTAVAAGQFTTLTKLVKAAGLAKTLEGRGPYTVFAPTDAAFAKVPKATLAALGKNPSKLRAVLLYHVVAAKVTAADAMGLRSAKTLSGKRVAIRTSAGAVHVGGARVVKADVMASNGVIHVIDRVLIP